VGGPKCQGNIGRGVGLAPPRGLLLEYEDFAASRVYRQMRLLRNGGGHIRKTFYPLTFSPRTHCIRWSVGSPAGQNVTRPRANSRDRSKRLVFGGGFARGILARRSNRMEEDTKSTRRRTIQRAGYAFRSMARPIHVGYSLPLKDGRCQQPNSVSVALGPRVSMERKTRPYPHS